MSHSKIMRALKAGAATVLIAGSTLALSPSAANAGTGPGGRCVVTWHQGELSNGYYAKCLDSVGLAGSTSPWNFRVSITCTRAAHATKTVQGGYSDWSSSASCPLYYDYASESISWVNYN
jgi:hypothetical protein